MSRDTLLAGIELGGTKTICAVGTGPDDLRATTRIDTTTPTETFGRSLRFFEETARSLCAPAAVGIASFGPLDLRRGSPGFGHITVTPKPGWSGADVTGPLASLGVPIAVDTDVNGAALGEWRWGAAQGLSTFAYVTVGTGIGGGAITEGRILHGLGHPEMGHLSVPRHPDDDYPGACPFHGDCLEGLASGPAIAARWARPAHALGDAAGRAVALEAHYLAHGLASIVSILAPERIVVGGGVAKLPGLLDHVAANLTELLGGYPQQAVDALATGGFVVTPRLGDEAGVVGSLAMAMQALGDEG